MRIQETSKFWNLVRLIQEVLRYLYWCILVPWCFSEKQGQYRFRISYFVCIIIVRNNYYYWKYSSDFGFGGNMSLHNVDLSPIYRWEYHSKSSSRLFTQPFVQAQIKENTKAPRHWPLWGKFNSPHKEPVTRKCFHLMAPSCYMLAHFYGVVSRL